MSPADRATYDRALRRARHAAYPPGEFVGQESFLRASEIRALARQADIGPETSVLDLCCGVGGPGRLITREFGSDYLGVDSSADAVAIARKRAVSGCRFSVSRVPPLPTGPFDVVLLLETMLAFRDKGALVGAVADTLAPGGRFAFTLEEGAPLTAEEAAGMPAADTVWPVRLDEMVGILEGAGLRVRWQDDWSLSHREVAEALTAAFAADSDEIAAAIGQAALDDLLASHRLWNAWLRAGRIRKVAIVAEVQED